MRRARNLSVIAVCLMLMACATLQQAWEKATPEEKVRFTIDKYQKGMIIALQTGNAFVAQNPKYKADYQGKVIPAIRVVQAILSDYINKGTQGQPFTFNDVEASVSAKSKEIQDILLSWGVK